MTPTRSPSMPLAAPALLVLALAVQATILHLVGQPAICACGTIRLWTGDVLGPENSQQITDWYTFSHVIHGMIFYGVLRLVFPRAPLAAIFAGALALEVGWELAENSPQVIARYREQALAQGYSGDSILNSLCDTLAMSAGFVVARLAPARVTVAMALAFEILTAVTIRDNLTLNVVQLVHPVQAVGAWQAGLAEVRR